MFGILYAYDFYKLFFNLIQKLGRVCSLLFVSYDPPFSFVLGIFIVSFLTFLNFKNHLGFVYFGRDFSICFWTFNYSKYFFKIK